MNDSNANTETPEAQQQAIVSPSWLVERLVEQIELTWSRLLVAGACQSVSSTTAAMRKPPKVGDLVLICATGPEVPATDRLGWFVRVEHLPAREIESDDDYVPDERRWVIDRLDGSGSFTWTNVSVMRVIRESRLDALEPVVR